MILNSRLAAPREFLARKVTRYSPFFSIAPVIRPVCGSSCKPAGKLSAAKVIGRSPVAAMVNKNGEPGRTPKIVAPLMRGFGEAVGVKITAGSASAAVASGCASPTVSNFASAPIRVVVGNSIAGITDFKQQCFDAVNIDGEIFSRAARFHDAALPKHLSVAQNLEFNTRRRIRNLAVHANTGGKRLGGVVQIDEQNAFGVRAETAANDWPPMLKP